MSVSYKLLIFPLPQNFLNYFIKAMKGGREKCKGSIYRRATATSIFMSYRYVPDRHCDEHCLPRRYPAANKIHSRFSFFFSSPSWSAASYISSQPFRSLLYSCSRKMPRSLILLAAIFYYFSSRTSTPSHGVLIPRLGSLLIPSLSQNVTKCRMRKAVNLRRRRRNYINLALTILLRACIIAPSRRSFTIYAFDLSNQRHKKCQTYQKRHLID